MAKSYYHKYSLLFYREFSFIKTILKQHIIKEILTNILLIPLVSIFVPFLVFI